MGIANQDHRVVERPRFDERESERHLELAEDRGPEGDRIDEQPVLVDEIEPHKGGGKVGTAEEVPVAGLARSSATVSARRSPATTVVLHPACSGVLEKTSLGIGGASCAYPTICGELSGSSSAVGQKAAMPSDIRGPSRKVSTVRS
jgi:hypothetical protein